MEKRKQKENKDDLCNLSRPTIADRQTAWNESVILKLTNGSCVRQGVGEVKADIKTKFD